MEEEEEENHATRLIGDSIVRERLHEFCGKARTTRKQLCSMPSGRLGDITAACEEATSISKLWRAFTRTKQERRRTHPRRRDGQKKKCTPSNLPIKHS